jgi:hypothetical protein
MLSVKDGHFLGTHPEAYWLEVKPTRTSGREAFWVASMVHTCRPSNFLFDAKLESGDVTVDYTIKRGDGGVQKKGSQFRIEDKKRPLLSFGD